MSNHRSEQFDATLLAGKEESREHLLALARESNRLFVRSLDQIAEDSVIAKGRRLTAYEAMDAYGQDVLREVLLEGSALLCDSSMAAGQVLKRRRELLGLTIREVAARSHVSQHVVKAAEQSLRFSIKEYEKIARVLGLDERYISVKSEPVGNENVAIRLRTIGSDHPRMTPTIVATIAEATWVAATQIRLEEQLGTARDRIVFEPSGNYGIRGYPAYRHGYYLALKTREKLGLDYFVPIESLRTLCEDRFCIPLIQAELGEDIAGVTVHTGNGRAIIVNLGGYNRNVYIRRSTIAHELGHLLYDIDGRLRELRVDDYSDLEKRPDESTDVVEQRANAFFIEFLAPLKAVVEQYSQEPADAVGKIMDKFGVSFTATRYQLWNGLDRKVSLDKLVSKPRQPDTSFEAQEGYTIAFHPIRGISSMKAGRFSAVVLRAAQERLISWQTAAEYLECSEEEIRSGSEAIRDLFPNVYIPKSRVSDNA